MTLTQTYSASLSGSYSGTALNPSNLGVNMTITGSYVKSDKYYGPPESSPNNCRLFKTKFYQERGNYHETYENNLYSFGVKVDNIYTASNYGSYACPTYCYNYSVDIYVP